jgi:hypothetical protein
MALMTPGAGRKTPKEYTDLILCRDIFHCTPDALDRQDANRVNGIVKAYEVEQRVIALRKRHANKRGGK